jgi:SAM-dependent methyltransferase
MEPAALWDAPGPAYEEVSAHLADAIEHAVNRLGPRPGERALDVGTGTGWAARRLAARGARVTGIDLGGRLIDAARGRAAEAGLEIDFRVADAEALPFEEASFDAVLSTFGVMFVARPEAAAAELARVCRKGGRIALAAWTPGSTVAEKFERAKPFLPSPPAGPSPFDWGRPERARELLGGAFDLRFERGVTVLRLAGGEEAWDLFRRGYGPTRALVEALAPDRREAYRREFVAFYERFRTELGVAVPREYLLAVGTRR